VQQIEKLNNENSNLRSTVDSLSNERNDQQRFLEEKLALERRLLDLEQELQESRTEYNVLKGETEKKLLRKDQQIEQAIKVQRKVVEQVKAPTEPVEKQIEPDLNHDTSETKLQHELPPHPMRRQFGGGIVQPNISSSSAVEPVVHALVPVIKVSPPRKVVPLRKIRKFFAKATGIHGLLSQSKRQ
jgi:septal ring factor EnvC (AmiA/AmiB activator)